MDEFQIGGGPCNSYSLPYDLLFACTYIGFQNAAFLCASTPSQFTEGSKAHIVSFTQQINPVITLLSTLKLWETKLEQEDKLVIGSVHTWPMHSSLESIPRVFFLLKRRYRAKIKTFRPLLLSHASDFCVFYDSHRLGLLHTAQSPSPRSARTPSPFC